MNSKVFLMDCREGMKQYPNKHFDLAVIDPPYGINVGEMAYLNEVSTSVRQKNGTRLNPHRNKSGYAVKGWDNAPPDQSFFDELKRISEHQIIFGIEYMNWVGLGEGRIKWDKGVADGVSFKRYEIAYCSLIEDTWELPLLWAGMCQAKSLSAPMTQQGNKKLNEKRIHPCHKPIMLYDAMYLRFGWKGMKVIDTHLGGGSNRISCHKNYIDFTGYEIDADYFNAHNKRWKEYTSQLRMVF